MAYNRIIAHSDFDGIASASLCLLIHGNADIMFSGPVDINMRKIPLTETDIIVDLPYGTPAGLWYDHHAGNTEDVKLLGIDPATIPGKRQEYPSCAGLIYDTFKDTFAFPAFIEELAAGVNRVDSFSYTDLADWRRETPDRIIDLAIKTEFENRQEAFQFMRNLAHRLSKTPVTELITEKDIVAQYKKTVLAEEKMIQLIDKVFKIADAETKKFILLDFSEFKFPIRINRSLAFLKEPAAHVVVAVLPVFAGGVKTNDLKVSMSMSIGAPDIYDLGDILRTLNIGDGHKGSASGKIESKGKPEMLKNRDKAVQFILERLQKSANSAA